MITYLSFLIFQSTNANMSEDDIREQFSLFDTDNSGDLDIEEYGDFCSKTRNRALASSVTVMEKKPVRLKSVLINSTLL